MTEPYPSNRLDRLLLRSEDWQVSDIKMIGTKEIPEEEKGKGEPPLWPSDHFG